MEDLPPAVTHLPNGVTRTVHRDRVPHQPGDGCVNHCYSHHIDEPEMGYEWCGECFHVFPTARALRSDYRRDAARVYLTFLRNREGRGRPYSLAETLRLLARLPFIRVRDITFCPHCTHDL